MSSPGLLDAAYEGRRYLAQIASRRKLPLVGP